MAVRLARFGARVQAAHAARDVPACRRLGQELNALRAKHPELRRQPLSHSVFSVESQISRCLAAVDCDAAFARFSKSYRANYGQVMSAEQLDKQMPGIFNATFPECAP